MGSGQLSIHFFFFRTKKGIARHMEYHQAIATIRFIVPCLNCVVMIVIWPWNFALLITTRTLKP